MSGQDSDIEILEVAMIFIANLITGIYILAILNFCQVEKQGRIWRTSWKKEGKRGEKKKEEKSNKMHVKIPLWSLNDRKKIHKNWEKF